MKIDVFWVWLAAFILVVLFQNYCTIKKSSLDVSYTWTTSKMDFIVYGQQSLTCDGDDVSWAVIRDFLAKDINNNQSEDAIVTVLAVHKYDTSRYWHPFWNKKAA
ncbi:MAG: hypothetical protein OEV73_00255 [Desulfobulbaceae bacterium]|nr:hypothetical protein [Desulfobulbaceae bacterium]